MQELERAIEVHQQWLAAGRPGTVAELLAQHPALAELLQAMLADRDEVERAVVAADTGQQILGDFRLLDELGRGGMGVVYRARQRSLDREVAVKVLPGHITLDVDAVARFRREATIAARLEHPNIVAIHSVGRDGDTHFFAMELIDGAPLQRLDPRTDRPRTVRECVELCVTIGDALAHAHAQGVLHRDVKPSNILVRRDGSPVLTDFGLARDADKPSLTRTGTFAGTPHYVSPEQAAGRRDVDARTDVWSLGATLYELLTTKVPFDGDSTPEILDRIHRNEPVDPVRIVPDLAPDLAAIVLKALEKEPARRYATMTAFVADLRAFLEFRPVTARRATALMRVRRWVRREPVRAALAGVLVLGVPALSLFAGVLIANRTAIQVGTRELRRQEQEERLARLTVDLEAGDYAEALASADLAIAERPDDIEAHAMRALVQVYSGKGDALGELDAAIASRKLAHGDRARVCVLTAMQRTEEATTIASRLAEPSTAEDLFLHGYTTVLRGQNHIIDVAEWRRVRDIFLKAMLVSPSPRLHYYLKWASAVGWIGEPASIADVNAVLQTVWPDSPAALLYVAFALRGTEPAKAAELYRRVLQAGHDHPRIHSSIAECLERIGDKPGALAARRDGLAAYERRERAGRLGASEELNFAIQLHESGRADDALARVRKVIARDPKMPRAQRLLGWLLTEAKDYAGAIAALDTAVELDPTNADALQRLGNAYLLHGDAASAVPAFRRLVELLPNNANAHRAFAYALLTASDFAGAITASRRALELTPKGSSEPAPRVAEAHFVLGSALASTGDPAGARTALQTAIAMRPDYPMATCRLAEVQLAAGERAAAIATYRQQLDRNPREPTVWEGLGTALLQDGQVEAGRQALQEAIARAVATPTTYAFLRGIAGKAEGAGDRTLAQAALRRAFDFTPTTEQRAAIEQELARLGAR